MLETNIRAQQKELSLNHLLYAEKSKTEKTRI